MRLMTLIVDFTATMSHSSEQELWKQQSETLTCIHSILSVSGKSFLLFIYFLPLHQVIIYDL